MEMDSNTILFQSVFMRYIESFAPHFHKIIYDIDDKSHELQFLDTFSPDFFKKFPRENLQYINIIQSLTKLSSFDIETVVRYLSKMFLDLLNQSKNSPFQLLQKMSLIMKQDNIYHQELVFKSGIYFLSDLLVQILHNGYSGSIDDLCSCGNKICQLYASKRFIDNTILRQWSVIFSILSENEVKPIIKMFELSIDLEEYESAFSLIQFLRLDKINQEDNLYLLKKIYEILNKLFQLNKLQKSILISTANIFHSEKTYFPFITNLFDFFFTLKNNHMYEDEAIENICILYKLIPNPKDIKTFYKQNVLIDLSNKSKIKQKLFLFQILMYGNQIDPSWLYWEWGIQPRINPIGYLKWNSDQSTSYQSIFMETFFQQSDFSVCYSNFSDVLLHFAALDFNMFNSKILPSFLSINDNRLVSFLMTIPKINTPSFIDFASTKVTFTDLNNFNEKVKPKIFECIQMFTSDFLSKHSNNINSFEDVIAKSDLKIEKKLVKFTKQKLVDDHQIYEYDENQFLNLISVIKVLPYIFSTDDYNTPEMLKLILQLSFNFLDSISSVAFPICESILTDPSIQNTFINIIIDYLDSCTSCSSFFTCVRLLTEMPKSLPVDVLHKIEFIAIKGISSIHPSIRVVSIRLLQLVNAELNNNGLYHHIEFNMNVIQQTVNFRLNVSKLKFHYACCSHFYELWLYFLCEIANIMVQFNYTPLLDQFLIKNSSNQNHMIDGLLIFYNATQFDLNLLNKIDNQYKGQLYQKFTPKAKTEIVLKENILIHSHVTLYPTLIEKFASDANPEKYLVIIKQMLLSNRITQAFAKILWKSCYKFIVAICDFFLNQKLNNKSLIDLNEINIVQNVQLCIDFCLIIKNCLNKINGSISINDWPISSRETVFRFLLNWMTTKSPQLNELRTESQNTVIPLIHVGPLFDHADFFNTKSLDILIEIEKRSSILSFLLYYHVELLLDLFIDYFYTTQTTTSDLILSALFMAFDAEYSDFLYSRSAPLLLLGFVLHIREHPRSTEFLSAIIDLITKGEKSIEKIQSKCVSSNNKEQSLLFNPLFIAPPKDMLSLSAMSRSNSSNSINNYILKNAQMLRQILPKALNNINPLLLKKNDSMYFNNFIQKSEFNNDSSSSELLNEIAKEFSIQTEQIFQNAFNILKNENLRIPIKDIVDILNIWSINIDLNPHQKHLMKNAIHIYTPYNFLTSLLKTTDVVGKSNFASIVSLWVSLMKTRSDFFYEFLFSCPCCNSIKQILSHLTYVDPVNVIHMVSQRCTFSYYYYVISQNRQFEDELWFVPFLTEAFKITKDLTLIPFIVHFTFIFVEKGTGELLKVISNAINIELPDCILSLNIIVSIVKQFVFQFNNKKKNLFSNKKQNSFAIDLNNSQKIGPKKYDNIFLNEKNKSVDLIGIWGCEAVKWLIGSKSVRFATLSMVIFNQLLKPIDKTVINGICKAIIYHIDNNSHDISIVVPLIQESFFFYNSVFDGNEKFCFEYASSFLNCRLFADTCLDNSIELFMKCLDNPKTKNQTQNVIMGIVRILIKRLESDTKAQEMFEYILKTQFNEELLMISLPICHSNQSITNFPYSFVSLKAKKDDEMYQSSLIKTTIQLIQKVINKSNENLLNHTINELTNQDSQYITNIYSTQNGNNSNLENLEKQNLIEDKNKVEFQSLDSIHFSKQLLKTIVENVEDLSLYHTLTYYSVMLQTSSNELMNSIFLISSLIIQKIQNKNQPAIEIIYKYALRNLSICQYAIEFISSIDNIVYTKSELPNCERCFENVCQSLKEIFNTTEKKFMVVTDLNSVESVVNLLDNMIVPKIFPFDAQQKVTDKMKQFENETDSSSDFVSIESVTLRRSNSYSYLLSNKAMESTQKEASWPNGLDISIYDFIE